MQGLSTLAGLKLQHPLESHFSSQATNNYSWLWHVETYTVHGHTGRWSKACSITLTDFSCFPLHNYLFSKPCLTNTSHFSNPKLKYLPSLLNEATMICLGSLFLPVIGNMPQSVFADIYSSHVFPLSHRS